MKKTCLTCHVMAFSLMFAVVLAVCIQEVQAADTPELKDIPKTKPRTVAAPELADEEVSEEMAVKVIPNKTSMEEPEKESEESIPVTSVSGIPEDIEKISVTGSRIKRIDVEGPSPILIIDREEMEKTGYNSVGDVLRDMSVNTFGSGRESSGTLAPGSASVSLRGLGADRTLVLIDGKRVQKDALTNAADLNLIPFAVVDRMEILKDSASAIYGSDALGGVVNIITRKDFNGSEASVKQFVSEQTGGNQTEVSLTSGYSNSRLSVTGVLYHRSNEKIYARDRDHSKLGLSRTGSPGTFSILKVEDSGDKTPYLESDGSVSPRSRLQAAPDCPANRVLDVTGGQVCQFNYADRMTTRPALDQTSAMLNTNFKVTDRIDTFVRLSGTHRDVKWIFAPTPAGSAAGLGVSGARARTYIEKAGHKLEKAFAQLRDDDFLDVNYRLLELGDRISEVTTDQYSTLAGMTMELADTWEMEVSAGYNRSFRTDLGVSGYARKDELARASFQFLQSSCTVGA